VGSRKCDARVAARTAPVEPRRRQARASQLAAPRSFGCRRAPAASCPGFSQRFTGTISADGNAIAGVAELCEDGTTWQVDLRINYSRVRVSARQ
jgi:hypothetical protein